MAKPPLEERLAKRFHELYEYKAPQYGYKTREESAVPWEDVPQNNKDLMIAVCKIILKELDVYQKRTDLNK